MSTDDGFNNNDIRNIIIFVIFILVLLHIGRKCS